MWCDPPPQGIISLSLYLWQVHILYGENLSKKKRKKLTVTDKIGQLPRCAVMKVWRTVSQKDLPLQYLPIFGPWLTFGG